MSSESFYLHADFNGFFVCLFNLEFYRVANYGLMDQMAALHWIQQNIEKFGGNPSMITLVGHGTGAACIDFLMSSPTMGKNFC